MTYEEWAEKFRPIKNHIDDNASFDGTMFETYGAEFEEVVKVANTEPRRVWTYVSGDAETITDGLHFVNRMGYFITEVPFEGEGFLEISLDEDEENRCRTEGCDEDPNDGEGFDGYCGNCADRLDQEGFWDKQ